MQQSFFAPLSFDKVYSQVKYYIEKESKKSNSIIIKSTQRGRYCINPLYREQQLALQFMEEDEEIKNISSPGVEELTLPFIDEE